MKSANIYTFNCSAAKAVFFGIANLYAIGFGPLFRILISFLVILSFFSMGGCNNKDSNLVKSSTRPKDFPSFLKAPSKADDVFYIYSMSSDVKQLSFTVEESFSSLETISFLGKCLEKEGYKKLDYDLLNPKIISSHIKGWFNFVDSSTKPHTWVYRWIEDWLKDEEYTVRILMEYRSIDSCKENLKNLKIHIILKTIDWEKPFVEKYKKLHPEESFKFEKKPDTALE